MKTTLIQKLTTVTQAPETGTAELLMCRPDWYGLEYEINPWMHRSEQPDKMLARAQWEKLYDTLTRDLHCHVVLISQENNCPDMVFTANAGLVSGASVLLSRFRHAERGLEEQPFKEWFAANGYRTMSPPETTKFEGEGDALSAGSTILAGYLKRSDIESHRWISDLLGQPVISLELYDSRFYHLDTCLFVLGPRVVAYYPDAFDTYGKQVLESNFETIIVTEREALQFGCNSIVIGRNVVMPSNCPVLSVELQNRGYKVYPVEMSEFIKAGGAAKCLVLFLKSPIDYGLCPSKPLLTAASSTGPS